MRKSPSRRNYRKRYRKTYRKRNIYKNKQVSYKNGSVNILRPVNGLPETLTTRLKYFEEVTINPPTGLIGDYVYRANDLYDPNYTGTGHQPMMRDQFAALYNKYCVIGSRCIARFFCEDGDALIPLYCGIVVSTDNPSINLTPSQMIEQGKSNWLMTNNRNNYGKDKIPIIVSKFSLKKTYGIKDLGDNLAEFGGPATGSPNQLNFYHIWTGSADGAVNLGNVRVAVQLDFIVRYTDPVEQAQS